MTLIGKLTLLDTPPHPFSLPHKEREGIIKLTSSNYTPSPRRERDKGEKDFHDLRMTLRHNGLQ